MPLAEFLNRYGNRGSPDWDPAAPRLYEQIKHRQDLHRFFLSYKRPAQTQTAAGMWLRIILFFARQSIVLYQGLVVGREQSQLVCYDWVARCRQILLAIAARVSIGEQIFELTYDEILKHCQDGDWPQVTDSERKRSQLQKVYIPQTLAMDNIHQVNHPPVFTASEVWPVKGLVPGYCRGPIRWVQNRDDAMRVAPGEIVAARHIDPSWFYLFSKAGALFLENASSYCHPVVLARELGIPTVSGWQPLQSGDHNGLLAELDATRGQFRCVLPAEK